MCHPTFLAHDVYLGDTASLVVEFFDGETSTQLSEASPRRKIREGLTVVGETTEVTQ